MLLLLFVGGQVSGGDSGESNWQKGMKRVMAPRILGRLGGIASGEARKHK